MRILGIDPGTRIAGYGIIDCASSNKMLVAVAAGVWRLSQKAELPQRLCELSTEFERVVEIYKPTVVCIELAFVAVNVRSAMYLGHARGVLMERAFRHSLPIQEVSATEVKKAVMGYGRGNKTVVSQALSSLLKINFGELPLDASDALGIAYTYARQTQSPSFSLENNNSLGGGKIKKLKTQNSSWAAYLKKSSSFLLFFMTVFSVSFAHTACNLFQETKSAKKESANHLPSTTPSLQNTNPLPETINTGN
jgi:crossover junction endodeoxyribonuclease RuvC